MKILIDVNLSPAWIEKLAEAGIQAVHWSLVGAGDASDAEIMVFAGENGYIILTRDLDFGSMLASSRRDGPSVVQIRTDHSSPQLVGDQVIAALHKMAPELEEGALVTIDIRHTRLRVLPIT